MGCEEVEEEDGDEAGEDAEEPGLTVERHSYGFVWVRYDKKVTTKAVLQLAYCEKRWRV